MSDEVQNVEQTTSDAVETTQTAEQQQENKAPALPDGIMRRFGELTAARRAAEEEAARLRAEVEQMRAFSQSQQQQQQEQQQNPFANQDVEQLVNQIAEQKLAERLAAQQLQDKVKAIESAGKEKYGDEFDRAVTTLQMTGIGGQHFLDALTNVKGSESVVRYLGDAANLDEAMRIASLPPVQMALAMSELAPKAAKQYSKQISAAPAPMGTVDGARGTNPGAEPDPKDTKAWMAWRRENARRR